jgi:hypothetical protein
LKRNQTGDFLSEQKPKVDQLRLYLSKNPQKIKKSKPSKMNLSLLKKRHPKFFSPLIFQIPIQLSKGGVTRYSPGGAEHRDGTPI